MYIPIAVGCVALTGSLVGGMKSLDSHWERADHAAMVQTQYNTQFQQMQADNERASLETKMELAQLKLHNLQDKKVKSPDDQDEIQYLQEAIRTMRLRLEHLK